MALAADFSRIEHNYSNPADIGDIRLSVGAQMLLKISRMAFSNFGNIPRQNFYMETNQADIQATNNLVFNDEIVGKFMIWEGVCS